MAGENVEVVRRWAERLAAGSLGEDCWHPDLVIVNVETPAFEGTYRGHDGLARWYADLTDVFDEFTFEVDDATAIDDARVLAMPRIRGRFRATGLEFDGPWAAVMTVRDGLIEHAHGFASRKRALRELGLEAG